MEGASIPASVPFGKWPIQRGAAHSIAPLVVVLGAPADIVGRWFRHRTCRFAGWR